VKAKCTIDALKRPPPPSLDDNYLRALKKTYGDALRSGTTSSYKRLEERRSAKKIPQLAEQANQSCPPLKVSSDIVANLPGMVPGTNPDDYLGDDVVFDMLEVDEFRYQYGKPLVKDGSRALTTMMRKFHQWYMETCRNSGKDALMMRIKEEHNFVGLDYITVDFDEFFQLYNQKALDKSLVACYCL
jgi:hypothetical protein